MTAQSKRCLVTGGCGFIGSHLVQALVAHGYEVVVIDRNCHAGTYPGPCPDASYLYGEVCQLLAAGDLLHGVDLVFHLAWAYFPDMANAQPADDIHCNLASTVHLLESCVKHGVRRIIFTSSGGAVYGPAEMLPVSENHPLRPISAYGITKLAAEKYVHLFHHLYGLEYVILRPSLPYGPGQSPFGRQGAIAIFLGNILRGLPIALRGDGDTMIRDFFYVSDFTRACLLGAASDCRAGVFNIAGEPVTLNQLVARIADVVGPEFPVIIERTPPRVFDVSRLSLDISQAQHVLGWQPQVPLDEGLARTWQWMRSSYLAMPALPLLVSQSSTRPGNHRNNHRHAGAANGHGRFASVIWDPAATPTPDHAPP